MTRVQATLHPQTQHIGHSVFHLAWVAALVAGSTLFGTTGAVAQETRAQESEETRSQETRPGIYVVRPGDTLESLAAQYLGSADRWRELWRLNEKTIGDPHRLKPGWKLNVVWRTLPKESVVLTDSWNEVNDLRPPRQTWEKAEIHDVLRTRDQVQTFKDSSAELTFSDATTLRMSEESLLLLEPTARQGGTVKREQVQLVTGQADLEASVASGENLGIDIVIGGATATPQKDDSGQLYARARKVDGQAQLMVYTGDSDLEAEGKTIEVPEGMGSTARKGEPPTPPEELLEAPGLTQPAAGSAAATPKPVLRWSAVKDAVSYSVELCRDASCAQLERRVPGLTDNTWQSASKLERGTYFWRITAQSASGLDGYPSEARELRVTSDVEDLAPPEVSFRVTEPHLVPRWGLNTFWILGPGARFEAIADDAVSGVDRWIPQLDGEEVEVERWQAGPWTEGVQQEASFVAVDRASNRVELDAVPFVYDATPPVLTWGVEDSDLRGDVPPPEDASVSLSRQPARTYLEIKDPHRWWMPWRKQRFTIDSDGRHLVITPNRPVRVRVRERDELLGPDKGLWIFADDAICDSVRRLDHRVTLEKRGGLFNRQTVLLIDIEVEDWVDNSIRGALEVETLGRR